MSFQVGSVCYSTPLAAAHAAASSVGGALFPLGSSLYSVDVSAVSASSISYTFTDVSSSSSFVRVVPFSAQPCGLLDTSDGLVIGWGIATAWLLTAGLIFLRRGVHL